MRTKIYEDDRKSGAMNVLLTFAGCGSSRRVLVGDAGQARFPGIPISKY